MVSFQYFLATVSKLSLEFHFFLSALGYMIVFLEYTVEKLIQSTSNNIFQVAIGMSIKFPFPKLCWVMCDFRGKKFTEIVAEKGERGKTNVS